VSGPELPAVPSNPSEVKGANMAEAEQETLVLTAKKNRHVVIALNHMTKRRDALMERIQLLKKEMDDLDAAILALE
jgi:hypothetical protein